MSIRKKSIFSKSSLFRSFIDSGDDFDETVTAFEDELKKRGLPKNLFKKFNNDYKKINLDFVEIYVNVCSFFQMDYQKKFFDYLFDEGLKNEFLHRLVHHWYFEEKTNDYLENFQSFSFFNINKINYLFSFAKPTKMALLRRDLKYPDSLETIKISFIDVIYDVDYKTNTIKYPFLEKNPQIKYIELSGKTYEIKDLEELVIDNAIEKSFFVIGKRTFEEKKIYLFQKIILTAVNGLNEEKKITNTIHNIFVLLDKIKTYKMIYFNIPYINIFDDLMKNKPTKLIFPDEYFIISTN